eukprot:TRINITY_DN106030_c0_g1_i1.p1 TRINITY_DN106030_c0_g1~~TRINITY_DN106030_c0_g1_i1.p1  ORF type:complete len:404 (-),score=83.13 TRINITY_DN106030_c0_g1_i1:20-1195(-)
MGAARHARGTASAAPKRLYPPGNSSGPEKAERFAEILNEELHGNGGAVELRPTNADSAWHSLRALCIGPRAADFEVDWVEEQEGKQRSLRVLARPGAAWEKVSKDVAGGYFVSNTTDAKGLAQKVEIELRQCQTLTLHGYADAKYVPFTMLKALATVPDLAGKDHALVCTVGSTSAASASEETVQRVLVHVSLPSSWAEAVREDFVAYPPGRNPDKDALKRFRDSVHGRLSQGSVVVMECRGRHATWHALEALAEARVRTAEMEVQWVDGRGAEGARALQIRAKSGKTWEDFNSTDFTSSGLLRAGEKSQVKPLAKAVGSEVEKTGAVALHFHADDLLAVHTAVKAVASVPSEHKGRRVCCVPSFGWTGSGDERRRSVRLYLQNSTRKNRR